MPTRPPSLRAVAAFEAAARHESFARAADELNLTHSAISHAIRGLEVRLGAKLFARLGRNVVLTHEGANLAKRVRLSLTLLTDALDRRPQVAPSRLCLGIDIALFTHVIGPHLLGFQRSHPEISLDIRSSAHPDALANGRIDLAVRAGGAGPLGLPSRVLAEERLFPVAAPGLARPAGEDQVATGPLIESREHPWSLWFSSARVRPFKSPVLVVDSDLLALELARSGMGIALAPELLARRDLRAGALIRLEPSDVAAQSAYHADWSPESRRLNEIAIFLAWMTEALALPGAFDEGRPTPAQSERVRAR